MDRPCIAARISHAAQAHRVEREVRRGSRHVGTAPGGAAVVNVTTFEASALMPGLYRRKRRLADAVAAPVAPFAIGSTPVTDAQPLDSDLTVIAALTTTAFARGILDDADGDAVRRRWAPSGADRSHLI